MPATLDAAHEKFLETFRRHSLQSQGIWPAPYDQDTPESLIRFLRECCWTYNESDKVTELIPDLPFIPWLAEHWWKARAEGSELLIQKSRRLVVSWTLTGCELWLMGLRPAVGVVTGLNYKKAAEFIWRHDFMARELMKRRPEFTRLKPTARDGGFGRGGNFAAYQTEECILPNGSMVSMLNQEGQSFQGSGYAWARMEEFCLYDHPGYMRGQAKIVTEGKAGSIGGFVVSVSNASPNEEWREIKNKLDAGELLGIA